MNHELEQMNKSEVNFQKEKELLEEIKKIILGYYPVIDNRMDLLFAAQRPALDICFYYYEADQKKETQISFLKGTESVKLNTSEKIWLDDYVSSNLIIELISFLLQDHDVISSFWKNSNEIELTFKIDLKEANSRGISCGEIGLKIDYYSCPEKEALMNSLLKKIFLHFFYELKNTTLYQKEYQNYCAFIKEDFRANTTEDELRALLNTLSKDDLMNLITNMSNESFLSLYQTFKKEEKSPFLRQRIPNHSQES